MTDEFIKAFKECAESVHRDAIKKGWWEGEHNKAEKIALMHSELSEALEAIREGVCPDKHCPEYDNLEVELADVVIRIMDFAEQYSLQLPEAIIEKMAYNKTRPYRHGGKAF